MAGAKGAAAAARSTLEQALGGAGAHLGDMVWLSLGGIVMPRAAVRAAYTAEGLPAGMAPSDPTEEAAFGMAVSAFGNRDEHGTFLKRVPGGDVLVLRLHDPSDPVSRVDTLGRVGLDGSGGVGRTASALWDDRAESVKQRLEATYLERMHNCTAPELGSSVVEVLCRWCGGIRLRERGNVYWVHASGKDEVRALSRAVAQLGSSYLAVLPVHDHAESRAAVQRAAAESFFGELRDAEHELARFRENAGLRTTTLERRLEQYAELRDRVELYADVLGNKRGELLQGLSAVQQLVRDMIAGADAEAAQ